jgi:hypothetical protein
MLLRHAEKPLGAGPPHGVTVDGDGDPESLTPRGWQRAGALVGLFVGDQADPPRLPTPQHLIASQIGPQSLSKRPRETLVPLSELLGLPVDGELQKEQIDELEQAIRRVEGVVLVAWEHHLIPSVAERLARDRSTVPQTWPDDRYDVVWLLEQSVEGAGFELRQVPERLLAGDRAEVIALAQAST